MNTPITFFQNSVCFSKLIRIPDVKPLSAKLKYQPNAASKPPSASNAIYCSSPTSNHAAIPHLLHLDNSNDERSRISSFRKMRRPSMQAVM